MELSESVQKGMQSLADPSSLTAHADRSVLGKPALSPPSPFISASFTGVKQNVDKSTISLCLEDVRFDAERTYVFYIAYQKYKSDPILLQNTNNGGSSEEVHFSCTMEQLQVANVLLQPIYNVGFTIS
uniref:Uncharacterized protein n=1 Tax=Oncorhynchus kisutch TaxID=8019 RepID=A0A8C7L2Z3_ONCKI